MLAGQRSALKSGSAAPEGMAEGIIREACPSTLGFQLQEFGVRLRTRSCSINIAGIRKSSSKLNHTQYGETRTFQPKSYKEIDSQLKFQPPAIALMPKLCGPAGKLTWW
jgi:hypothetical protein